MGINRKEYIRDFQNKWLRKRRTEWLLKNGPCKHCGSWERLEIDHIDPATKMFHSRGIFSRSKEIQESELNKCQVLCYFCHKKKSAAEHSKRFKGIPNLRDRKIPSEKFKEVIQLISQGLSERKACAQVGLSRGTFSSTKLRGLRIDVFGDGK